MKWLTTALAVASLTAAIPAHAQFFVSGNDLWEQCRNTQSPNDQARCSSFIVSVVDTYNTSVKQSDALFCTPPGITIGQLVDVAKKHLEQNPEHRHIQAALVVMRAFRVAFGAPPCR